jgi:hypothetical protein
MSESVSRPQQTPTQIALRELAQHALAKRACIRVSRTRDGYWIVSVGAFFGMSERDGTVDDAIAACTLRMQLTAAFGESARVSA